MSKKKEAHETEETTRSAEAEVAAATEPAAAAGEASPEQALAASREEAQKNWDLYLRARADLENYRKRAQREKEDAQKYGNESLLLEILPAVDNMERALAHSDVETRDAVLTGVRMTLDMLQASLKKFGVTPVDTAPGTPFDSALHQALGQVESAEQPPNTVVQELQRGYLLNDRLLRPALVMVAKAPAGGDNPEN